MNWEKFKSFLLSTLIFASFALTGIFMFEKTSGLDDASLQTIVIPPGNIELNEIIHPQGLYVNFGGDSHTAFFFNSYSLRQETFRAVQEALEGRELQLVEDELWQTILQERSIRIKYDFEATLNEIYGSDLTHDYPLDEVLIPLTGRDFILVKSDGEIYKFSAFLNSALEKLVTLLEEQDYVDFKTIEKRFSIQSVLEEAGIETSENLTLIPIEMDRYLPLYRGKRIVDPLDQQEVEGYVRKVFGEDLSFIKSMVTYEDAQIFVSNYGKRSLTFETDGTVEYVNNRVIELDPSNDLTVEEGIKRAWDFVEYMEGSTLDLYLLDVTRNNQQIDVQFGSRINGYKMSYLGSPNGAGIEVHILGDEIIYYRSNRRINLEEVDISHLWTEGLSFSRIFDKNFNHFLTGYEQVSTSIGSTDTMTVVFEILSAIEDYDFEYVVDVSKGSNSIIPAWKVTIADMTYYIDIYDGVMLGAEKESTYGLEED